MRTQPIKRLKGMKINKICACGIVHKYIPTDAKDWFEDEYKSILLGYLWQCECKSHLFVSAIKLTKESA